MMKQLMLGLMLLSTLAIQAQRGNYLAGAVPVVDGRVVFEKTIDQPAYKADALYAAARTIAQKLKASDNALSATRIEVENADQSVVIVKVHEWLTFKRTALVLDRAQLIYTLVLAAKDGQLTATIKNISYINEADPTIEKDVIRAENWITDAHGLNKKGTKLAKISGKFRAKTVDRMDEVFALIEQVLAH